MYFGGQYIKKFSFKKVYQQVNVNNNSNFKI